MSISKGLRIISVTKSLDGYQRGDQKISQYFSATMLAGHAGLFLSSLRKHKRLTWDKFCTLAAVSHIDRPLLRLTLIPWLTEGGFIEIQESEGKKIVHCNVLDYDAVLNASSNLFRTIDPTPEEIIVLDIVKQAINIPTLKGELLNKITSYDTEHVERAIELADGYKIVQTLKGEGVKEPLLYSPLIWGDKISKAGKALANLKSQKRDYLLELLDIVRQNQGLPYKQAVNWAKERGQVDLVEFAERIGILDKTQIITRDGQVEAYLTTPHLYGELAANHGKDVCDRIRLFLDSVRHGQFFGECYTGRIQNPVVLLDALLSRGTIGPCTAIGRDYILVEKAGIVNTVESKNRPGRFFMKYVQDDTIKMVRDILEKPLHAGTLHIEPQVNSAIHDRFMSAEETRITTSMGHLPAPMKEAEESIMKALRETTL